MTSLDRELFSEMGVLGLESARWCARWRLGGFGVRY